ncbi:hypothetical protein J4E91_010603, partial [Alternaria rosae]
MTTLSPQRARDASNASEPTYVDITELCDACVKLTEAMVTDPGEPLGGLGQQHYTTEDPTQGLNPVTCELCSPACATLLDRPPILSPHMSKACDLAQHWRKECNAHENCPTKEDVPLPTRILELCGDSMQPSVKLIETQGRRGKYVALSHCWGSVEKRPLRTISENFAAHQDGIPFKNLPKTFQDAVELTLGIGIRYIWIDSLCIIQDSYQDWLKEAALMGDVYWNADLVVAASGAKDSSEGLFIKERPLSTVLRLPYRQTGERKGTFNMTLWPKTSNDHPRNGPLARRAWTFQERYLAGRLITFMPNCVSWICNMASVAETGEPISGFYREQDWPLLLREYTTKSLTCPEDRVAALRGIGALYQRYRKDLYIPEYGVWEKDLTFQLLWFNKGRSFDDGELPGMPSWSWAAIKGAKTWPPERNSGWDFLCVPKEMPELLAIDSAGHLRILGHLSTILTASSYVQEPLTERDLELLELGDLYRLWKDDIPGFHLLAKDIDGSQKKEVLGIARFDNDAFKTYTHTCFLGKETAQEGTWWLKREPAPDAIYQAEQHPQIWYWALFLTQIEENKFKRVGLAALLP